MINRNLYRDILTEIQILYQNNQISTEKKNRLVKIMSSTAEDSENEFIREIRLIMANCHESYLIRSCERCISVLTEDNVIMEKG